MIYITNKNHFYFVEYIFLQILQNFLFVLNQVEIFILKIFIALTKKALFDIIKMLNKQLTYFNTQVELKHEFK